VLIVYFNSFAGQFVFDDLDNIVSNDTIKSFTTAWQNLGRDYRPLVTFSLAANYAFDGLKVWYYHAFNVAVHVLATLSLYALLRRVLLLPRFGNRYVRSAGGLAFVAALLWAVHPLQTQCVTYIIQRAQSLTGLFLFLTLYYLLRGSEVGRGRFACHLLAIACCALGMGSKQDMVVAPILALLFDRIFLAGSWRYLLRQRWALHLAFFCTWIVLTPSIMLAIKPAPPPDPESLSPGLTVEAEIAANRPTAGFGVDRITPYQYALTQTEVILFYLQLIVSPHPLTFDYSDWPVAHRFADVAATAAVMLCLLALTGWALLYRPPLGFLGAWFFLTLAPSSSIMPIDDVAFEHRLYLAMAAVITLAVLGFDAGLQRLVVQGRLSTTSAHRLGLAMVALAAVTLGFITVNRNPVYRDPVTLWQDVISHRPNNFKATHNLANLLATQKRYAEAIPYFQRATEIKDYSAGHALWANCLFNLGRLREAAEQYRESVRTIDLPLAPGMPLPPIGDIRYNLAHALEDLGEWPEAIKEYQETLRMFPKAAPAAMQLGMVHVRRGEWDEAAAAFRKAIAINPEIVDAHNNLGMVLTRMGRPNDAITEFRIAVELGPGRPKGFNNWGVVLWKQGQIAEAAAKFTQAARVAPQDPLSLANLAQALNAQGQKDKSRTFYRQALRRDPQWPYLLAQNAWSFGRRPPPRRDATPRPCEWPEKGSTRPNAPIHRWNQASARG
jgi:tetratricopeptide (TPR) repeat protein